MEKAFTALFGTKTLDDHVDFVVATLSRRYQGHDVTKRSKHEVSQDGQTLMADCVCRFIIQLAKHMKYYEVERKLRDRSRLKQISNPCSVCGNPGTMICSGCKNEPNPPVYCGNKCKKIHNHSIHCISMKKKKNKKISQSQYIYFPQYADVLADRVQNEMDSLMRNEKSDCASCSRTFDDQIDFLATLLAITFRMFVVIITTVNDTAYVCNLMILDEFEEFFQSANDDDVKDAIRTLCNMQPPNNAHFKPYKVFMFPLDVVKSTMIVLNRCD